MVYRKRRKEKFLYRKRKGNKIYPIESKKRKRGDEPNLKALKSAVQKQDGKQVLDLVRTEAFNALMNNAYEDPEEYHIEEYDGLKVMVVKGSVGFWDHAKNAAAVIGKGMEKLNNAIMGSKDNVDLGFFHTKAASRLDEIAKKEQPDILIGHSRGGATMSYMKYNKGDYLTLDGAMLTGENSKHIYNVYSNAAWWDIGKNIATKMVGGAIKDKFIEAYVTDPPTLAAIGGVKVFESMAAAADLTNQVIDKVLNYDHEGPEYADPQKIKQLGHSVYSIENIRNKKEDIEAIETVTVTQQENTTQTDVFN